MLFVLTTAAGLAQTKQTEFIATNKKGMAVLATWSVANMAVNGALLFTKPNEQQLGFYSTNMAWNGVNGLLAFSALHKLNKASFNEDYPKKLKRAFAVNTFIDLGYIAAGGALALHKNSTNQVVGVGQSIALQGTFLLVFDAIMWQSNARILPIVQSNAMGFRLNF